MIDNLGIDFECVEIAVVSGDDHVVPLVVMQSSVTIAFDEVGTVTKIKDVMDVPEMEKRKRFVFTVLKECSCITDRSFQKEADP